MQVWTSIGQAHALKWPFNYGHRAVMARSLNSEIEAIWILQHASSFFFFFIVCSTQNRCCSSSIVPFEETEYRTAYERIWPDVLSENVRALAPRFLFRYELLGSSGILFFFCDFHFAGPKMFRKHFRNTNNWPTFLCASRFLFL